MKKLLLGLALIAAPAHAQTAPQPAWDAAPWLEDLAQLREALQTKYANFDWLTGEREFPLDRGFEQMRALLAKAGSDAEARRLFDRLIERIGDGHVDLNWPSGGGSGAVSAPATIGPALCGRLGYRPGRVKPGTAAAIPGYRALDAAPFASGMIGDVGVVRIGLFDPHGYPELCAQALAASSLPAGKPCDDACEDLIITAAFRAMTDGLAAAIERLKAEGARTLLVDISANGGGSDWVEAAARIVTARRIRSARIGFVRGAHWAKQWGDLAERLRGYAKTAGKADRARLLGWAAEAEAARREALAPCDPAAGCARLGSAGYATGLVGDAAPNDFAGKQWGVWVFNPVQYGYRAGVWDGPLIVLTDGETWSAAEQFAAVLRDNEAAIVLGGRTGGAGCGHTWGGTPTTLGHSGAVLEVPDCVRYRADGSNEVRGIIPDVMTGVRPNDGAKLKGALTAARLAEAVERARAQYAAQR